MKISIKKDKTFMVDKDYYFPGDEYVVDLDRQRDDDPPDSLICRIVPWETAGIPLTLEIAICKSGEIVFRSWNWSGDANCYLHTYEPPRNLHRDRSTKGDSRRAVLRAHPLRRFASDPRRNTAKSLSYRP